MSRNLEVFSNMPYPGRIIIIGKDKSTEKVIVIYAITGRSPSSQSRRIVFQENNALVEPVDEALLSQGDPDLLIYPALMISDGIAVSNGKQTVGINSYLGLDTNPIEILSKALTNWEFEPDSPNYTPRISGCLCRPDQAALSILKHAGGGRTQRQYFEFPLIPGMGKLITTYTGENRDPLPSFCGEPMDVELTGSSANEMAEWFYSALEPKISEPDFRVAIVCVFSSDLKQADYTAAVINRYERK